MIPRGTLIEEAEPASGNTGVRRGRMLYDVRGRVDCVAVVWRTGGISWRNLKEIRIVSAIELLADIAQAR